tara:strand:+ start:3133 stop:4134 length:1002 start_codon:yes stop_codon:yes gene_type:complete
MRKLYLLLLILPFALAQGSVFDGSDFVDDALPDQYSNQFSLSAAEINLAGEEYFDITIINQEPDPLFLIVDYPSNFLEGAEYIEIDNNHILRINVDNSTNSFGLIEFKSPEHSLFLPVVHSLAGDKQFGTNLDLTSDVFHSGQNMTFNLEMIEDESKFTKNVQLEFIILSSDNQNVLDHSKIVQFDALFDQELSLYVPEHLSHGEYAIFLQAKYESITEYDYSLFTLTEEAAQEKGFGMSILILIAIVGLFIFLIHNSHKHLSKLKKIHTKHSLSIKKHHASRAKVELVEKKLSSIRSAYLEGAISKKNYELAVKKLRERLKQLRDSVKRGPK